MTVVEVVGEEERMPLGTYRIGQTVPNAGALLSSRYPSEPDPATVTKELAVASAYADG